MTHWLETYLARLWNRRVSGRPDARRADGLDLGTQIIDGQAGRARVAIPQNRRAEHLALIGKTAQGKSSAIHYCAVQDIAAERGFLAFDLHGETTPFLVAAIADHERVVKKNLSDRLIIIDPTDPVASVGFNPLEQNGDHDRFVQIAEFAQLLKQRWSLDSFGARTDELLRNSLIVLAESGLTLVEIAPLLANAGFRAACLPKVRNAEVRQYFADRYDRASEAMQATMREPILNKTSAFTADRHFRHIIGQARSTFSLQDAMDRGCWVIVRLPKGQLGEQAVTLGSLVLGVAKHALFSRKSRELFTLYCDEIQNLVAYSSGLEAVLSESRKFGVGVVSANQFLDQYPAEMRAAILAVGTHIFFQLSSQDAHQIATALDGGKPLAELLKNLPRRHMVVKTGHERWREVLVPTLRKPQSDPTDLFARSRNRWARLRNDVEAEIENRQRFTRRKTEDLHDWE
jgi:hypothetical protein